MRFAVLTITIGLAFASGCGSPDPQSDLDSELLYAVKRGPSERTYREIDVVASVTIPLNNEAVLFDPKAITASRGGELFVSDYGNMTVKRFASDGRYITTYGAGIGAGPGEHLSLRDVGVLGDSVLFTIDSSARRMTFFDLQGKDEPALTRTQSLHDDPISRFAITSSGREYAMLFASDRMFRTSYKGITRTFGDFLPDQQRNFIQLDGKIVTDGESMVFALSRHPAIFRFNREGRVEYAIAIPGGDIPRSERTSATESTVAGGFSAVRVTGRAINIKPTVLGDLLAVHARPDSSRSTATIDYYEVATGEYLYSVLLPDSGRYVVPTAGGAFALRDTTVQKIEFVFK